MWRNTVKLTVRERISIHLVFFVLKIVKPDSFMSDLDTMIKSILKQIDSCSD
jgi:hypothetical protein